MFILVDTFILKNTVVNCITYYHYEFLLLLLWVILIFLIITIYIQKICLNSNRLYVQGSITTAVYINLKY